MAKELTCVVGGCSWTTTAPTEDDILEKVAGHAADDHDVKTVSPELLAQVKAAIRDR